MGGSSRGGGHRNRGGGDGGHRQDNGQQQQQAAATDPRIVLEAVATNPVLQQVHVVLRDLVQQGLDRIESGAVRQVATSTFSDMLAGTGPSFTVLQGELRSCQAL